MTKNPVGRAMVYGKALVDVDGSAEHDERHHDARRGRLPDRHRGAFDLIAGIDSAFSIVEASNPECASQTGRYRQQKGWVDLVNHAIELGQRAGQADSAVYLAKRSLQLYANAPYGYMVLAQASAEKNQPKEAINYYKQAIALAAKDTSAAMQDNRRNVLMTIGNYAADLVDAATGEDKART